MMFLFGAAALVYAAGAVSDPMDILKGLGAGAIAAAIGFGKSQSEKFDAAKFFKTVIFGGVVGAIAAWKGTNMDEAEKWAAMTGISLIFSFVWDAIVRKVAKPGILRLLGGPGEGKK